MYRTYWKDIRGCWGKRRAFNWCSPLIVSHAAQGILLTFTSLIRDLGTALCTFSAKLCGCNSVAGMLNRLLNLSKSSQCFRATLRTVHIKRTINEFLDDTAPSENVITSLDALETISTTTTKRCLKIKTTAQISCNEKCFDKEFRLKRYELRKLANKIHRDPLNTTLREDNHTVLRQHKDLLNHRKNELIIPAGF